MNNSMCAGKITNLAKAMLEVQKVVHPAIKDKLNTLTQSRYATLKSVMEACSEALIDAGVWVTQYPVPVDGNASLLGLVTKLVHAESGEWQESLLVMPLSTTNPQGYGSALTYARRYGLSALVGIVTEDDDANAACNGGTQIIRNNEDFDLQCSEITNTCSHQPTLINDLPHIDGVNYQKAKAQDGSLYITATGNIRNKNSILKEVGFQWDSNRKLWWKAA